MKIAVNCRSILKPRLTGIGRNTFHLLDKLGDIDQRNQYSLYCPQRLFDFKRQLPRFGYKNFVVKQDAFGLGPVRCVGKHDLYHVPCPDDIPDHPVPVIVTVHDLIYKTYAQSHTPQTIALTERHMESIARQAAKIICTSESTRRDLHSFFKLAPERSCVVYNGVDHEIFFKISDEDRGKAFRVIAAKGVEDPYILLVGTIEPRKNLPNTLVAFAQLKEQGKFQGKLVVVGSSGWMMEEIAPLINQLKLKSDVLFLGYINDEELCYLYNLAEVFVYPSFYEGFGFPIAEALCCGAAVVTSNVSSCPEVAGDAALCIDPASPQAMAGAIASILEDNVLKQRLQSKAIVRGEQFSFLKTAQETLKVYEAIYNAR